ncbi:hypothetical protein N7457_008744 [Penicillium paradoxum]|uniref:uncharacterized protein n=1 Tax=Penicillium paradoxum TaxID=176176 RepID=UPI0025467C8A|nr:uncharacterized protein N7457_008744 [Penicillium paradoxum]KAJ5773848.1 hypothetical protein N7457_008744 [Penicillium paradoxum]
MAGNEVPKVTFKSSRLLYRAVENSEEDIAFFQNKIHMDSNVQTMSTMRLIRPANKADAEQHMKMMQNNLLGVLICLPPQESSEEIESSNQSTQNSKSVPIGFIALFNTAPERAHHRNAMIAISLVDGYQGKGYGGEAINWVLDWGFRQAGLHRIAISTFEFNHNALKLYRKLGFVEEGREREALYHYRAWHDVINLSMLEHEWEALRGESPS